MTQSELLGIVQNAGLLLAMAVVFDLVSARTDFGRTWVGRMLAGIATGLIGIGLMAAPLHAVPGVQFDTRSVVLSVSGLFLGAWPTAIAAAMTSGFRMWLGGAWVVGVLVIVSSAAIGVAWRPLHLHLHGRQRVWSLFGLGVVVHVVMLSLIATIPGVGLGLAAAMSLPVMSVYPLATVALGLLLTQRLRRERTDARLRQSEERYRLLAEQAQDLVYRYELHPVRRFTYVSPSATALTGYSPEDHYADPDLGWRLVHEDDHAILHAVIAGDAMPDRLLLLRWRRRDGRVIWTEQRTRPITDAGGRLIAIEGVARDVTAREEASALLSRREREYRELFDANPHPMWVFDLQTGRFLAVNARATDVYGYSREEFLQMTQRDLRHADDTTTAAEDPGAGAPDPDEAVGPWRHRAKDGRILEVEITWHTTEFGGRPARLVLAHDVTAARRVQAERDRLIAAIEQSDDSILITDAAGTIEYVNPAFERVTGYRRDEALGANPRLLKSGEQDESYYRQLWQTLLSGYTWRGRLVNKRKDGTLFAEDATISPVRSPGGQIESFVAVKRDITRDLELQAQYLQAQKMEGVGRLAAGVAHDFNNLLTIINGSAELAATTVAPDDPVAEDLRQILAAGARAAALTRQLLAFSRQQIVKPVVLDLDDVIDGFRKMLARLLKEDIVLDVQLGLHHARVKADPGYLEQIILNLAVNARDAMPSGGTLRITTASELVSAAEAARLRPAVTSGRYAVVRVADTGVGMDAATQARIFEPFFTTKAIGKGTGLGLATVLRIVQESGGGIRVTSAPGAGTTFEVFLPEVVDATATDAGASAPAAVTESHGTVLLVEDEEMLRVLAVRALHHAGFTVVAVANGREGLEAAQALHGPLDLVITDVIMPEMGGREMVQALATSRPGVPVLYTSGYTGDLELADWLSASGAPFLAKPYTPAELVAAAALVIRSTRTPHP